MKKSFLSRLGDVHLPGVQRALTNIGVASAIGGGSHIFLPGGRLDVGFLLLAVGVVLIYLGNINLGTKPCP